MSRRSTTLMQVPAVSVGESNLADLPAPSFQRSGGTSRRSSFKPLDRVTGLVVGCAVGDALGMPVEGLDNAQTLRSLRRLGGIRDFLAPQAHVLRSLRRLRPGCWTDDSQLMLSIVRNIVDHEGQVDYEGLADAHVNAFEMFELRGWNPTTKQACRRLAQGTSRIRSGKLGGASNVVAAKIAPIAAATWLQNKPAEQLLLDCEALSLLTHNDPRSIVGAYIIGLLVRDALSGARKWSPSPGRYEELIEEALWAESVLATRVGVTDDPLSRHLTELHDALDSDPAELAELCNGATDYVCDSVSFIVALLCGRGWDFEEGVLAAVNGGGATGTNGAIMGSILGASWGLRKIPRRFSDKVEEAEMLRELGQEFASLYS